jgi:hypothetical protein
MADVRLLLISRDDILRVMRQGSGDNLFRPLATLTRQGVHLLATAAQPEEWAGEHGSPDDALLGPESIRKRLSDAGGTLDGVYYVRRSLLTQKRNREAALQDILERYAIPPRACTLLSSHVKFVQAASRLGIHTSLLGPGSDLLEALSAMTRQAA